MTSSEAFKAWWKSFPERFSHQKNHAKIGWHAACVWQQMQDIGLVLHASLPFDAKFDAQALREALATALRGLDA